MAEKQVIDLILKDILTASSMTEADLSKEDQAEFELLTRPKTALDRDVDASLKRMVEQDRTNFIPGFSPGESKPRSREEFNNVANIQSRLTRLLDALEKMKKSNERDREITGMDIPDYDVTELALAREYSKSIAGIINNVKPNATTTQRVYETIGRHVGYHHS